MKPVSIEYRPASFEDVIGQTVVTRSLANRLRRGHIHPAYVFAGTRGTGKTTVARILARSLNCEHGPTPDPCATNPCAPCAAMLAGLAIDVCEIDAATNTGVDNVREEILRTSSYHPVSDRYRVFIIDEAHQLTPQAFNALLKTLEEPPDYCVFVLCSTELHKFPDTILSRCQVFEFRTVPAELIARRLAELAARRGVEISEANLLKVARVGDGSVRDAETALESVFGYVDREVTDQDVTEALGRASNADVRDIMIAVETEDAGAALGVVARALDAGCSTLSLVSDLMAHVRDLVVAKATGAETGDSLPFSVQDLIRFFEVLAKAERALRVSRHARFHVEIAVCEMVQTKRLYLVEEALAKLNELSGRVIQ